MTTDLQVLRNRPTLGLRVADFGQRSDWPDEVFGVVTNSVAVEQWAQTQSLPVVAISEDDGLVQLKPSWGSAVSRRVGDHDVESVAQEIMNLLEGAVSDEEGGPDAGIAERRESDFKITTVELQRIEVVLGASQRVLETVSLDPEDRLLLETAVATIRSQVAAPQADRMIVGRALRRIALIVGGLVAGVAANYMTDLLRRFGVPWP